MFNKEFNLCYGFFLNDFTDIEIKNRKMSPGVGKYNPEAADKVLTIGLRKGYK